MHHPEEPRRYGYYKDGKHYSEQKYNDCTYLTCVEYYDNKTVKKESKYINGDLRVCTEYYENGITKSTCRYENGKKHGLQKYHSTDGQVEREESYFEDKKDGVFTVRYKKTGQLKDKISYKDDKLNGDWTEYYQNGKVKIMTYYIDEMKRCIFEPKYNRYTGWFSNGQISFKNKIGNNYVKYYKNKYISKSIKNYNSYLYKNKKQIFY